MSHLDYEINKELGECYLFMGDLDKAEQYYRKASNADSTQADPFLGLATISVQRGDLNAARTLYKKANKIEPSDKSFAGMALIEAESGEEHAAIGHFSLALDMNPENMIALFGIIRMGHVLERMDEVVPHLENYLQIDPTKHEIRYAYAGCLMKMGRSEEALAQLDRILEIDPANAEARELYEQIAA